MTDEEFAASRRRIRDALAAWAAADRRLRDMLERAAGDKAEAERRHAVADSRRAELQRRREEGLG